MDRPLNGAAKVVRIGGASGFWGDSSASVPQLVRRGRVDYLTFDYLAELTMSILTAARAKDAAGGWAKDFVDVALDGMLPEIAERGIRVLSNAGGMNPRACANALAEQAAREGVRLRIAVVEGDDVSAEARRTKPVPQTLLSANAYLGAFPIAAALERGAQVVITGRCVDSALPLAALIYEFGWPADAWDLLAAGSLAGHILECGAQGSGGLHTDWERVERWHDIGYPIAECRADGSFVVTKAPGTGGLVVPASVAEQMLYEIGDPGAYVLPDVVCDFRNVTMDTDGEQRVCVSGAAGAPPPDSYKVSATYLDGFRCVGTLVIIGIDAAAKARRTADAILARTRLMFAERGFGDYRATNTEIIGAEHSYGPHSRATGAREVMLRLCVDHADRRALDIFAREVAPAGTSWSPGTTGAGGGRPKPSPLVKFTSFSIAKRDVRISLWLDGSELAMRLPPESPRADSNAQLQPQTQREPFSKAESESADQDRAGGDRSTAFVAGELRSDSRARQPAPMEVDATVPLVALAFGRSGDKGDTANIGIIARKPELVPLIREQLTAARVAAYFAHLVRGAVRRYEVPGIGGFNFVLEGALGGGGMASMRIDPLGKGMAQMLLDFPIRVPAQSEALLSKSRSNAAHNAESTL